MKRALFLCLLLASLGTAHAAAPPPQWLPQDSWPGGKQYDPRLERTVKLWGTGVPAAEVFASIAKQTGVALGFDPPDDDNARICLNVYLNPKEPPTLREMLVQIGWVMDCAWAVEGEGEQRRYVLLHTTIGEGDLVERVVQEGRDEQRARDRERKRVLEEMRPAALAKLEQIGAALPLSREEVLRRYRGDDFMLVALLDPARRASARFLLSLPPERLEQLEPESGAKLEWPDLTADQQARLIEAGQQEVAAEGQRAGRDLTNPEEHWDDPAWIAQQNLRVWLCYEPGGFSAMIARRTFEQDGAIVESGSTGAYVWLNSDPRLIESPLFGVEIARRRILGETITPHQEGLLAQEYEKRREQARLRSSLEKGLASWCRLSSEAAARLSAVQLPASADGEYALWQLQEATAVQSGLHVVSDSFRQPPRSAKEVLDLLSTDRPAAARALLLLQAHCASVAGRDMIWYLGPGDFPEPLRWEWGDAGRFLRFRSVDRDVWRAAFLPEEAVTGLDAALAPHLPPDLAQAAEAKVPIDVRHCGALLDRLTRAQRTRGGTLNYADPSEEGERWQQSFRDQFLRVTSPVKHHLRVISELSDEQWERLNQEGLRLGQELRVARKPDEDQWDLGSEMYQGHTIRVDAAPAELEASAAEHVGGSAWRRLGIWSGGGGAAEELVDAVALATEVTIRPDRLPHLVPPPPEYAP
jgi:hypothetical protein